MGFSMGDIVHHRAFQEEGRVVRVVRSGRRVGYVVRTVSKVSGREIESLWSPRDIKERAPKKSRLAV